MDTRYMKTLAAVVDTGSFSRAASSLNITQSAVSQRVKFMEEQYGYPLLDRTGATIVATEAGVTVLRKVRQILSLEREMEEELKRIGTKARLSLCCTPTFGIIYLPAILNRFFLVNSVEMNFTSVLNMPEVAVKGFRSNDYDLIVIEHCDDVDLSDAITFTLPDDQLSFISAPSLGLPPGRISLDMLLEQRLIARREGCSSRCLLQQNLKAEGKSLDDFHGIVVHDDLNLTIRTTVAGSGIAFVSRSLVKKEVDSGLLVEHCIEGFRCSRPRTMAVNRGRSDDASVRGFVDCVREISGVMG